MGSVLSHSPDKCCVLWPRALKEHGNCIVWRHVMYQSAKWLEGPSVGVCLPCLGRLIIGSSQSFWPPFLPYPVADQDLRFLSFLSHICYTFRDEEIKISVVSVRNREQTALLEGNGSKTESTRTTEPSSVCHVWLYPGAQRNPYADSDFIQSRSWDLSIQPCLCTVSEPGIYIQ